MNIIGLKLRFQEPLENFEKRVQGYSLRERILGLILCGVLSFAGVFFGFHQKLQDYSNTLKSEYFSLSSKLESLKQRENLPFGDDLEVLQKEIQNLTHQKAIQEQRLLLQTQKSSNVFLLEETLREVGINDFSLTQDFRHFYLSFVSDFKSLFRLLSSLDFCFWDLEILDFVIYPKGEVLEAFVQIQQKIQSSKNQSQGNWQ